VSRPGRGTLEEGAWCVGHVINIEEHVYDSLMGSSEVKEEMLHFSRAMYYVRMKLAEIWLQIQGLPIDSVYVRNYWCIVKHFLSLQIHLQEFASMLERDGLTDLSRKVTEVYKETISLRKQFMEILRKAVEEEKKSGEKK